MHILSEKNVKILVLISKVQVSVKMVLKVKFYHPFVYLIIIKSKKIYFCNTNPIKQIMSLNDF
ncbi:hypothetical protein SAMN05444411_1072 [Lutibacter oricola]|uniref:Uncharacterized protein n=1 Tax=Lutibacter oricola TaxID=762486 RepID=A0A1H3CY54_9FLAO|nr:hypothetical protein SAMN05444411_1072 [Lutibacter oricola]